MTPKVALVNMSNIGECPQLALALQDAGMLECWYTALYYEPKGLINLGAVLPAIKRRHHHAIDSSRVHTVPAWEWLRLMAARLPILSGSTKREISGLCSSKFTRSVAGHLSNHPVDVVIGVNSTSLEVFQAAKEKGILAVLSQRIQHPIVLQEVMATELKRRGVARNRFLEANRLKYIERCTTEIKLADLILCPSQSVIDSMVRCSVPKEKLALIPFGVDLTRFSGTQNKTKDDKFRILYVGGIGHRKGIPYLVEAFRQLELPDGELLLIGELDGVPREIVSGGQSIIHIGWTPPDQLNQYYLSASIFALPSLSEGSALVSYEAMAAGLPVIATSASGTVVRDGEDGFIVSPGDVEALKDRIRLLYDDRELRNQMGQKAKEHVQEFSWENYRQRIAYTLQQIWWYRRGKNQQEPVISHS